MKTLTGRGNVWDADQYDVTHNLPFTCTTRDATRVNQACGATPTTDGLKAKFLASRIWTPVMLSHNIFSNNTRLCEASAQIPVTAQHALILFRLRPRIKVWGEVTHTHKHTHTHSLSLSLSLSVSLNTHTHTNTHTHDTHTHVYTHIHIHTFSK